MNSIERIAARVPQSGRMAGRLILFLGAIFDSVDLAVKEGVQRNRCRIITNEVNASRHGLLSPGHSSIA